MGGGGWGCREGRVERCGVGVGGLSRPGWVGGRRRCARVGERGQGWAAKEGVRGRRGTALGVARIVGGSVG